MKIVSFYTLFGTFQSVFVAVYYERDPEAWKLDLNFDLLVIILTVRLHYLITNYHDKIIFCICEYNIFRFLKKIFIL